MTRLRRIALSLVLGSIVLFVGADSTAVLWAQDETPTPTWTVVPIETQTPLPSPTVTASATDMATDSPTATDVPPTATPIPVEVTAEVTEPVVATDIPTIEPTTEVTSEPSPEPPPTLAPTATSGAVAPEPPLTLIYSDNFDTGSLAAWIPGAGWSLVPNTGGQMLQVFNSADVTRLRQTSLYNVAIQLSFQSNDGGLQFTLRESTAGGYTVTVLPTGEVTLARSGVVVQTSEVAMTRPDVWRTLRVSAIENVVRVTIDDVILMTFFDGAVLPPGGASVSAIFPPLTEGVTPVVPMHTLNVDDVMIWIPTAEIQPVGTLLPTATATLIPTNTPTATATAESTTLPPEPPLTLLYSDTFDFEELLTWTAGTGWTFVPHDDGLALQVTGSDEPVVFAHNTLVDVALVAQVQLESGAVRLDVRANGTDAYTATLDMAGNVFLYRSGVVLATTTVTPPAVGTWQTLRLSAVGDIVRVSVDGIEVLAVRDTQPLAGGAVSFGTIGGGTLRVDDVEIWWANGVEPTPAPTGTPVLFAPSVNDAELDSSFVGLQSIPSNCTQLSRNYFVISTPSELNLVADCINVYLSNTPFPAHAYFRIFLRAGTYEIGAPIVFDYPTRIYGLGSDTTFIRGMLPPGTSAPVIQGPLGTGIGRLELHDLTIDNINNGGVGYFDYGGALYGNIALYNIVIENSQAQNGGGAIFASQLFVQNSIFRNNSAGGGGAIQLGGGGTAIINCTLFENNHDGQGGAFYQAAGVSTTINYSVFNNNYAMQDTDGFAGAIRNDTSDILDATNNWWPTGSPPAVEPDGMTTSYDTISPGATVNVLPVLNENPLIFNPDPLDGHCGLRQIMSGTIAEELEVYYGVRIAQEDGTGQVPDWNVLRGWDPTEAEAIREGVRNTAIALAIQSGRAPIDAFYEVMRRDQNDTIFDTWPFIVMSQAGSDVFCETVINVPTTITCGTENHLTEYTVVHELGHVFSNRSDQQGNDSLREWVEGVDGLENHIYDDEGHLVMGWFSNRPAGTVYIWDRGQRGWGSGPAARYDEESGLIPESEEPLTNFQQNGPPYNPSFENEYDETAADMFLNWVYRIMDPELPITMPEVETGFRNITWDQRRSLDLGTFANQCFQLPGCPDTRNPGNARFNWMNMVMDSIFQDHQWNLP